MKENEKRECNCSIKVGECYCPIKPVNDLLNLRGELAWAMALSIGPKHVSSETYKKYKGIVLKYPQYFYKEYKYFTATKEQHEEYRKQELLIEKKYRIEEPSEIPLIKGEGIVAYLHRREEWPSTQRPKSMEEIMKAYDLRASNQQKLKRSKEKLFKKIYKTTI